MEEGTSKAPCKIEGCDRPSRQRGWCRAHYGRWYRHGDPLAGAIADPVQRFLSQLAPPDENGCRRWTGPHTKNGYGKTGAFGKEQAAHRAAYEQFVGAIPEGYQVDHVKARGCRHRDCCEPSHLEPVTPLENQLRGDTFTAANTAKTHCPAGHPYDETHTYWRVRDNGRTHRQCRTCSSESARARAAASRMT